MRIDEPASPPDARNLTQAKGIEIVVIGDGQDSAAEWAKFQFPSHLLVKNVPDMVNKVINACLAQQARMFRLVIVGHGMPGQQQVGDAGHGGDILDLASVAAARWETTHRRRKLVHVHRDAGPLRAAMSRLTTFFMPDGEVVLGGCLVGDEPELARAVAQLLHVRVSCYCALQRIPLPGVWLGKEQSFDARGGQSTSSLPIHLR